MSGIRHSTASVLVSAVLSLLIPHAGAQPYDILLKGGHVIDAANEIDAVMDVAVQGNLIRKVAAAIPESGAKKVVHVEGLYVTPGLIDLHGHVTGYGGALYPDDTALLTGTTTLVDAGGAGWRTFEEFRKKMIDVSKTRVLALIHIAGGGMAPEAEGDLDDMDPEKTAAMIKKHRDVIVGIKHAHYPHAGWDAIQRAVKAGQLADVPVMFDDKIFTNSGRSSREKLLDYMRPGDMHTHCYNDRQVEIISRFSGKVHDYAKEARRRGVLFDLGHGGGSFLWPVATRAMRDGFPPDTISTDLHHSSILGPEPDMPNCISKMMALGMSLEDAVMRSTQNPAKAIGKFPEIGTLGESKIADITVLRLEEGVFAYKDAWGKKKLGDKKLEAVMTVRNGEIVFDLDGLAFPNWKTAGRYELIQ